MHLFKYNFIVHFARMRLREAQPPVFLGGSWSMLGVRSMVTALHDERPFMRSQMLNTVADAVSDTDPPLRVLRQFRLVFSAVRRHFAQMEKSSGLGGAPIWALSLIARNPGMRVNDLARAMDIHQSTASNLVRALIQSGHVHSEKSIADKRVAELYPLPAGHKLLRKVPGPYTGVLPQALRELDTSTLLELEGHLALLLQKLDVDERSARTPMALM